MRFAQQVEQMQVETALSGRRGWSRSPGKSELTQRAEIAIQRKK